MTDPLPDPPPGRKRRRVMRWLFWPLVLMVLALGVGVWVLSGPLAGRVFSLPDWARERIETRADTVVPGTDLEIGDIGLGFAIDRALPRIVMRDVLVLEGGAPRVALPQLEVELAPMALMRGEFQPRRIAVTGAGLRLSTAEDGVLDLSYEGAEPGQARSLAETMAAVDAVFAGAAFSQLESVTGAGMNLTIDDPETGELLQVTRVNLALTPSPQALSLTMVGAIEGMQSSRIALAFRRVSAQARSSFAASFENLRPEDVAHASEALGWLSLIEAPVSGQMRTDFSDAGVVGDLTGRLNIGAGQVVPGGGTTPIALDRLSMTFGYDAARARLTIPRMEVASPVFSGRISGHADLRDGPAYVAQLHAEEIAANPRGIFPEALQFDGAALDLRLQLDPVVTVDLGQMVLFDDGLHLTARGRFAAEEAGLAARLDVQVPAIAARDVLPLWPIAALPGTRGWLEENMLGGQLRNVHAALRVTPGTRPQVGVSFDFEEAQVRAIRALAPIERGAGYFTFHEDQVVVSLDAGQIPAPNGERLDLAGSLMRIADTNDRAVPAVFDLGIEGSVPAVLTLIEAEPLNLLRGFPYDAATLASGLARLDLGLDLGLGGPVALPDVAYRVTGELLGVRSDQLVPDRQLSAARLSLEVGDGMIEIGGPVALGALSAQASWRRQIGPGASQASQVTGRAEISAAVLADFGVVLPDGMITGSGPADFTLELLADHAPQLSIASDLAGIGLAIPELGWSLGRASQAALALEMRLGPDPQVRRLTLSGAGMAFAGDVALAAGGGGFEALNVERLQLGNWLDVTGRLVSRGAGRSPRIEIAGGRLDLRGLPQGAGQGGGGGDPAQIALNLDRLTVTDQIFLTSLGAELGGRPFGGRFTGNIGGEVPVQGQIATQADGIGIELGAGNGGGAVRAAGIYPNAYGGALDLTLTPLPGSGNYAGFVTIDNPRLRNAPAFAELLSAISVVGLLDQMSGDGIGLGTVEVDFRLTPGRVTILEATAVGPSMGLSLEGIYDTAARYFDFEGVVSPLYLVNGLVGGLFTPRREGLFGFTYQLRGTPENSNVTVNPLSVLTPGIFREIFRRPPPEVSQ